MDTSLCRNKNTNFKGIYAGLILIAGVFIIIDVRYFVGNFEKVSKFPKKARNHLFLVFCLAIFNTEKHQLMYISHFITITH